MAKRKDDLGSWPVDFVLTDNLALFAKERGFDPLDEFEDFRDWAESTSARYASWPAAFRTRIRNKVRWRDDKKSPRPIGFIMPKASPPAAVLQALKDNALAEEETRTMTIEQRREASRKFSEMAAKLK